MSLSERARQMVEALADLHDPRVCQILHPACQKKLEEETEDEDEAEEMTENKSRKRIK
jgi:hypothetical protein